MRADLAAAMRGVLCKIDPYAATLDDNDEVRLLGAANLVTLARTAVEYDGRGEVIDAHAPEMPTRFAKMLGQIVRGARAVGMVAHGRQRLSDLTVEDGTNSRGWRYSLSGQLDDSAMRSLATNPITRNVSTGSVGVREESGYQRLGTDISGDSGPAVGGSW